MVNFFGPLAAENVLLVWGTPANFNGFRVLAAYCTTLLVGVSQTAALNRGRHLYSAGRPSRWALAHISSLFFLFVSQISQELLNGSAPNLQGRHVCVLVQTSLNVKVKGQGHQGLNREYCCIIPIDNALQGVCCMLQIMCSSRQHHSVAARG